MNGNLKTRFRRKVVLYATWHKRLLVFTEPEFPEAGTQVPGGTVMDREAIEDGARREFVEETGFAAPAAMTLLGRVTHVYEADGIRHEHARSFFHLPLTGDYRNSGSGPKRHLTVAVARSAWPSSSYHSCRCPNSSADLTLSCLASAR